MLNNAWPEMVWHLYDYYLNAGGAFYGVRNALAPLHPMFAYDDNSVWVTASVPGGTSSYAVKATVVSVSGDVTFAQSSEAFTINSPGAQVGVVLFLIVYNPQVILWLTLWDFLLRKSCNFLDPVKFLAHPTPSFCA